MIFSHATTDIVSKQTPVGLSDHEAQNNRILTVNLPKALLVPLTPPPTPNIITFVLSLSPFFELVQWEVIQNQMVCDLCLNRDHVY